MWERENADNQLFFIFQIFSNIFDDKLRSFSHI